MILFLWLLGILLMCLLLYLSVPLRCGHCGTLGTVKLGRGVFVASAICTACRYDMETDKNGKIKTQYQFLWHVTFEIPKIIRRRKRSVNENANQQATKTDLGPSSDARRTDLHIQT